MTIKDAIQKAEAFRGTQAGSIGDCGDRWAVFFKTDEGGLGSAPVFVFKDDGRCEFFFIGDYIDLLKSGKEVEFIKEAP